MGLIKAGIGALGGTLADQWKEFFYCESMPKEVLVTKGQKRVSGRSSNTKGNDNIISNGSGIAVADGQCMIIVEQGKVVEVCAEPHLPAQPIKTIHMIKYKIHAINAPTDHHTDIFSQKCKTNKITAGSSPSIFISIFMKRQGKKLPLRFELRIFSSFYLTSSREPPMYRSLRHRHR